MATLGGILKRITEDNISGRYAGDPWQWPPAPNCQQLFEELEGLGIVGEEINVGPRGAPGGSINSTGEFVINAGVGNASALVDAALQKGAQITSLERSVIVSATRRLGVSGIGGTTTETFLPLTRLGELRGQDIAILLAQIQGLPTAVAEAFLRRIVEADRDGQLGYFTTRSFSGSL